MLRGQQSRVRGLECGGGGRWWALMWFWNRVVREKLREQGHLSRDVKEVRDVNLNLVL